MADEAKKLVIVDRMNIGTIISEDRLNELAEEGYYYAGTMQGRIANDPPEGMYYHVFNLKQ